MDHATGTEPAILVEGVAKTFGDLKALRAVDFSVPRGSVLGLLGPNGAGKTTMVRILTTLLRPDAGRALVAGFDVVSEPQRVRQHIGLTGQQAAVDGYLSGRANLEMVGRLYHLSGREARRRADELLEQFDLSDAATRLAKTYSGGMRRRLDLAAGLVAHPPVLFLDEPTTGLDPRSRLHMWKVIERLVEGGTTLLLTTQYLDEADTLADRIVVIDHGRLVAEGSPAKLKRDVGGERIDVVVRDPGELELACAALTTALGHAPGVDAEARRLTAPTDAGADGLVRVVRELDAAGVAIDDIALRSPTLDEVFMKLTGHGIPPGSEATPFVSHEEAA